MARPSGLVASGCMRPLHTRASPCEMVSSTQVSVGLGVQIRWSLVMMRWAVRFRHAALSHTASELRKCAFLPIIDGHRRSQQLSVGYTGVGDLALAAQALAHGRSDRLSLAQGLLRGAVHVLHVRLSCGETVISRQRRSCAPAGGGTRW